MNRTLKEATVRRYHYETHRQLREHLEAFLNAYNFAKRLKTLWGLTPYEHICKAWADVSPSPGCFTKERELAEMDQRENCPTCGSSKQYPGAIAEEILLRLFSAQPSRYRDCYSACNFDPLSWGIGVQN